MYNVAQDSRNLYLKKYSPVSLQQLNKQLLTESDGLI